MAVAVRQGELEVLPGGRGHGPGKVVLLRSAVVEDLLSRQIEYAEMAEWAEEQVRRLSKLAAHYRRRQRDCWERIAAFDGPGAA